MPKIQLDIPTKEYNILKNKAKEDMRSLTNYLTIHLIKYANNQLQMIDTSVIPENTQIKIKTQRLLTEEELEDLKEQKYHELVKQQLGEHMYNTHKDSLSEYYSLTPDNRYYEYAEERPGKITRLVWDLPEYKQKEYIEELRHYL